MRFKDEFWRSVNFDRCQISHHCQGRMAAACQICGLIPMILSHIVTLSQKMAAGK